MASDSVARKDVLEGNGSKDKPQRWGLLGVVQEPEVSPCVKRRKVGRARTVEGAWS